jgi:hypothetical protein
MGPTIREAVMAHHTNLLIMKGHFKRLPRINTTPIPIVLSIDLPTQMEPSFISEKCKFWVKNTVMYCLQKPATKNAFFSRNRLLQLLEPVLFYTAVDVSF